MLGNQQAFDDNKSEGSGSERSSINLGGGDPSAQQKKALKKPVKSVIPKLQNCSVNLSLFRKLAADELRELIEEVVCMRVVVTSSSSIYGSDPHALIIPTNLIIIIIL